MINYFVGMLENHWAPSQFFILIFWQALLTGLFRLAILLMLAPETTYCSITHLSLIVLMGCRQALQDRSFDTKIPFITKTIQISFKDMPVVYLSLVYTLSFLFELTPDWSLLPGLWVTWMLMRLFVKTKSSQQTQTVGDPSQGFALQTFFPERAQPYLDYTCRLTYSVSNICGAITFIQNIGRPADPHREVKKEDSPKNTKAKKAADHSRKKALKMLDEEIEKKSGFTKMLEAAKNMVKQVGRGHKQEDTAKQVPEQDEESKIVNKEATDGEVEAKKLIKAEKTEDGDVEEEFQI